MVIPTEKTWHYIVGADAKMYGVRHHDLVSREGNFRAGGARKNGHMRSAVGAADHVGAIHESPVPYGAKIYRVCRRGRTKGRKARMSARPGPFTAWGTEFVQNRTNPLSLPEGQTALPKGEPNPPHLRCVGGPLWAASPTKKNRPLCRRPGKERMDPLLAIQILSPSTSTTQKKTRSRDLVFSSLYLAA